MYFVSFFYKLNKVIILLFIPGFIFYFLFTKLKRKIRGDHRKIEFPKKKSKIGPARSHHLPKQAGVIKTIKSRRRTAWILLAPNRRWRNQPKAAESRTGSIPPCLNKRWRDEKKKSETGPARSCQLPIRGSTTKKKIRKKDQRDFATSQSKMALSKPKAVRNRIGSIPQRKKKVYK